jgi:hypothetical protein
MDMSFNFLIQAIRVLQINNYDDDEVKMIYKYTINLDYEILNEYYNSYNVMGFENDLILYIDIIESLIFIYEDLEEYEKCYVLKRKKDECLEIINKNKK